jgi:Ca2+-binding EF-hand superfamily protein
MEDVYKNICRMNRGSYLKKGIALYFANYFDLKEEKNKFYKYFSMIDKDRNGLIFFDEFVNAYQFKVISL